MMLESSTLPPSRDRRVRRSRAVLMAAAVTLVSERGTADVPVAEIADTADVSRRLVYQQFHDRETLLLEAA
ncbi:MAG: helix-turn-helix domain-containing protein, partial [Umezawaea sp.]